MIRCLYAAVLLVWAAAASGSELPADSDRADTAAIRALLDRGVAAWNRGDLDGFMATYWRSEELRFASGGNVHRGWQATLERYRSRYGTEPETMGRLAFEETEITPLAPDAAVVFGRYFLEREGVVSNGLFTLTVKRLDAGWRIIQDHTSAAAGN